MYHAIPRRLVCGHNNARTIMATLCMGGAGQHIRKLAANHFSSSNIRVFIATYRPNNSNPIRTKDIILWRF